MTSRYSYLSPDGLPIEPRTYATESEAAAALARWVRRFDGQGYYAAVDGRIALADLPAACTLVITPQRRRAL